MEREQQDSRWADFSNEELQELHTGAIERQMNLPIPAEYRERAGRLATEIRRELRRREARRSYQGPGLYYGPSGREVHVLGRAVQETSIGRYVFVVLARNIDAVPRADFDLISEEFFDALEEDGSRRFIHGDRRSTGRDER